MEARTRSKLGIALAIVGAFSVIILVGIPILIAGILLWRSGNRESARIRAAEIQLPPLDSAPSSFAAPRSIPLPTDPTVSFDLSQELQRRRALDEVGLRFFMGMGWGLLIFGAALLVLSIWFPGNRGVLLIVGVTSVFLGPFMMVPALLDRWTWRTSHVLRLDVGSVGLTLVRPGGTTQTIHWDDPNLQIDLNEVIGPSRAFLPSNDPRRVTPYWMNVFAPPKRYIQTWSTIPEESLRAIVRAAEAHGVPTRVSHVGFYWFKGPKMITGVLMREYDGGLEKATSLNGREIQLRGRDWANFPTGYLNPFRHERGEPGSM